MKIKLTYSVSCFLLLCLLQGCFQDVFWPSETRIQLVNDSSSPVDSLIVLAPIQSLETISLISEHLEPGERSRVEVYDFSGRHTVEVWGGCDKNAQFCQSSRLFSKKMTLDGGSVRLRLKDSDGGFILEMD